MMFKVVRGARGAGSWVWVSVMLSFYGFMEVASLGQTSSSVVLTWHGDPSPGVVGYNLYSGGASGSYTNVVSVGNATNATVSGLVRGATYFFAVTAINSSGLESMPSPEINYAVPLTNTTRPPAVVLTAPANGQLRSADQGFRKK